MSAKNIKYLFYFLILVYCQTSFAQVSPKKEDTAKVYRAIEKYSKKRKFTKYIHRLFFEPITEKRQVNKVTKKIRKPSYAKYEGKIIRNIKVTSLDPFSYSVTDTTQKPTKKMAKIGNALHLKTKNFTIYNMLLFKKNQPLDSLLMKESERLIRQQRFVHRVAITTTLVSKKSDSVDVSIRVLDSWSLVPDLTLTTSKSTFFLKERNFLGTGHEFSNSYTKNLNNNSNGFGTSYTIPNIKNTFITTNIRYDIDVDGNYRKSFSVERPFYSPYARWAGGMSFDQQFERITPVDSPLIDTTANSKFNSQDFWGGHSVQIFKGNTETNRATNFITSARFYNKEYSDKPIFGDDTLGVFSNEKLYLVSMGISSRKYKQDKYIFNFDVIEDIASGFVCSVTSGYQNKNSINRLYFGAKVAIGGFFNFGYLSTDLQYGTFFKNHTTEQSAYNFSVIYFTNLIDTGKWKFRQFVKPQAIIGTKRINSNTDKLTLNGDTGIPGFNSNTLFGTKKMLLTFQTQAYSPWHTVGFRFNPFLSYTMGMLGQANGGFNNSKLFSELAVGVIISNDYWVFSNFQFSFSYFPTLPEDISSVYKTNSLKTYDFGLQDFQISKPVLIGYQ